MMNNIAVIGAGQLGSRHIQGLAGINIPINIFVVEPNEKNREIAESRYNEMPVNKNINTFSIHGSLVELPENIDVAIIATNADVRASVTVDLINNKKVSKIIFEKVLFQKYEDYDLIESILLKNKIDAWVNCPRRTFPFYKSLKDLFMGEVVNLNLNGGNWGMGCNSMHFIDLMGYLNSSIIESFDTTRVDSAEIESKRKGFIELTGTLCGKFKNCAQILLESNRDSIVPPIVDIYSNKIRVVVFEHIKKALVFKESNGWKPVEEVFDFPFQSQLTNHLVSDIISKSSCDLANYSESSSLHKPFIKALILHINSNNKEEYTFCPIT
jgi:hypothetical protein